MQETFVRRTGGKIRHLVSKIKGMDLKSWFVLLSAILMCLYPILSNYVFIKSLSITLGHLCLSLIAVIFFIFREKIHLNILLIIVPFVLFLLCLVSNICLYGDISPLINNFINIIFCFFVFSIIGSNFNFNKHVFLKTYVVFCYFAISFCAIQFLMHYLFNIDLSGKIPFLTPMANNAFGIIYKGRPNSIFSEPAHYAIYISPLLFLSLKNKKIVSSIITTIGLLISMSSTGILSVALIYLMFLFTSGIKKWLAAVISLSIVATFVTLVILLGNSSSPIGVVFQKFTLENMLGNERVFLTVPLLSFFDFPNWVYGIGINRLRQWAFIQNIDVNNYAPSPLFSLFSFGIVGTIFLFTYLFYEGSKLEKDYQPYFLLFLVLLSTDQMLFNHNFWFLLFFVFLFKRKDIRIYNEMYSYYMVSI